MGKPPTHSPSAAVCAYWTHKTMLTDVSAMDASMGNCVPPLTFILFATMMTRIDAEHLQYGLRHHPDTRKVKFFMMLKKQGVDAFRQPHVSRLVLRARDAMRKHLMELDVHLMSTGRPYICGPQFTTADVGMMPIFERLEVGGWEFLFEHDLPNVAEYWRQLKQRHSYEAALKAHELKIIAFERDEAVRWKAENPWLKQLFQDGVGGLQRSFL